MYQFLKQEYPNIDITGFNKIDQANKDIKDIHFNEYQMIVWPINGINHDYSVLVPYNDQPLILNQEIINQIDTDCISIMGLPCKKLNKLNNITLLTDDEIKKENGIYTAEGIVADIINNTDKAIKDANIVILGYGNIAKPLYKLLQGFSNNIKVGIIENNDINDNYFYTNHNIIPILRNADIIINTATQRIITSKELKQIKKETYLLEVASKPYGIDIKSAEELGLKVKLYPSIPAQVASYSVGKLFSEKVKKLIRK